MELCTLTVEIHQGFDQTSCSKMTQILLLHIFSSTTPRVWKDFCGWPAIGNDRRMTKSWRPKTILHILGNGWVHRCHYKCSIGIGARVYTIFRVIFDTAVFCMAAIKMKIFICVKTQMSTELGNWIILIIWSTQTLITFWSEPLESTFLKDSDFLNKTLIHI